MFIYQIIDIPKGVSKAGAIKIFGEISRFLNSNWPEIVVCVIWYKSELQKHKGFIKIYLRKKRFLLTQWKHEFSSFDFSLSENTHKIFKKCLKKSMKKTYEMI